jgi:hypothetical protein
MSKILLTAGFASFAVNERADPDNLKAAAHILVFEANQL